MSIAPNGRIDAVFYDYNEATGLTSAVYGQVAAGGSTMTRTVLQSGIDGEAQPPAARATPRSWATTSGSTR